MMLEGTIVSGHVRLDVPSNLPEGTRVRLVTEADEDLLPPKESREEFLAGLRESIAESNLATTRPAREALKELAIKHGLRLLPGE